MPKRKTQEQFILDLEKKYPNKFDTSEVKYITNKDKVTLTCKECGLKKEYRPDTLLKSIAVNGCFGCEQIRKTERNKKSLEYFLNKANKLNDKLDFSEIKHYVNNSTKVPVICKKCNFHFLMRPDKIFQNHGCPKCVGRERTTEEAILELKKIYGDIYDFSNFTYINSTTPSKIKCIKHGVYFEENFHKLTSYTNRRCCYKEWQSSPNLNIQNILNENNIKNIPEYIFKDCRHINPLKFDFYLPDYNTVIEYQGEWHFKNIKDTLEVQKKRDEIKREYCRKNNIIEVEIPYWDYNNAEKIIKSKLNI